MKEITVLSGKGGAGKTLITAALASLATEAVFCDNDVDAADLHLIFSPTIQEKYKFDSGSLAAIHPEICTNCGLCESVCRFDAIHPDDDGQQTVNPLHCEGCRLCERVCPVQAITMQANFNNEWYVSATRFGTLVHARMGAGEENSGKLVTKIRQAAKKIASDTHASYLLNDGPPGIGCAAIASVTGTNLVLVVIEPSLSGLHDARRLIELVKTFNIPVFAVINKYDLHPEITATVENYLFENRIPLAGKIPFDIKMVEAMVAGKTILEFAPEEKISGEFYSIWEKIRLNVI